MTMQRRHFELIADVLRELNEDERRGGAVGMETVAFAFARKLRSTNPNFNEARFLRACGVEG